MHYFFQIPLGIGIKNPKNLYLKISISFTVFKIFDKRFRFESGSNISGGFRFRKWFQPLYLRKRKKRTWHIMNERTRTQCDRPYVCNWFFESAKIGPNILGRKSRFLHAFDVTSVLYRTRTCAPCPPVRAPRRIRLAHVHYSAIIRDSHKIFWQSHVPQL